MGLNSLFQRGSKAVERDAATMSAPEIFVGDFVKVPLDVARGLWFYGRATERLYNPDRMIISDSTLRMRMTVQAGQAVLICTSAQAAAYLWKRNAAGG